MRRIAFIVFLLVAMSAIGSPARQKLTDEQRAENRARLDSLRLKKTGGRITVKEAQGRIVFVNAQGIVPAEHLAKHVESLAKELKLNVALVEGSWTEGLSGADCMKEMSANIAIFLREGDRQVPVMLVAPEDGWAAVNVTRLASDGAREELVASRLRKEMSRAFAYMCGRS